MKKWVVFLFIGCLENNFSQTNISPQFSELKGMEDQLGNTHLFYRIFSSSSNDPFYSTNNDIYHLDLMAFADTLFLADYNHEDPAFSFFRSVNDYTFWNNDFTKFIFCGSIGSWEPGPYLQRFDGTLINLNYLCCEVNQLDISISDDSVLYAGGWIDDGCIRSFDGGFNWNPVVDSLQFLSLNPFNDNILFLENDYGFLYRSTDAGNTFDLVELLNQPAHSTSFSYDPDQLHIYRLFGNQTLRVSSNQGEPFPWQTKYSSDSEIFISNDESISGTIYLADKKNILVSTDYGDNFTVYKTLDRKIVGIYKKSDSNKLYAATKYKIYEITPDTTQIIKSIPIPEDVYEWFPLNLGDMWLSYHEQIYNTGDTSKYFLRMEVVGFKEFENKIYTKALVNSNSANDILEDDYNYYRVDSLNGFVYKAHFQNDSTLWFESFLMDLLAEVGDTIPFSYGAVLESEEPVTQFGVNSTKRNFEVISPFGQHFEMVKGFGLVYDTLWTTTNYVGKLLGCVINGVVYGDTTTVGVEDEEVPIANEFRLEQNYPNPFNPSTKIKFTIPSVTLRQAQSDILVTLKVYDVLGNEIATLVNEELPAGEYEVEFNTSTINHRTSSGIYFYQLKAGSFIQTKKMIHLK